MITHSQLPDMRLLFLAGAWHFRQWFKPEHTCDCGQPGKFRTGDGYQCARCRYLNSLVEHECDLPYRLSTEEWKEARNRSLQYHRDYNRRRRKQQKAA